MAAAFDHEGAAVVDFRFNPVIGVGEVGESGEQVDLRQRAGGVGDQGGGVEDGGFQAVIEPLFNLKRAIPGVEDPCLHLGQVHRGEADLIGGGLAVDEGLAERGGEHLFRVGRGGFDEIAQHVIVLDLQALDAGALDIVGLHPGDDAAPFVAKLARLIQIGVMAGRDEAAVADQKRRFGDQRTGEKPDQIVKAGHGAGGAGGPFGLAGGEAGGKGAGLFKPRADRDKVAWPAAVQRQARQGAVDVGNLAQIGAQRFGQRGIPGEGADRLKPGADLGQVAGRCGQAAVEKPGAARRHRPVYRRDQRSLTPAGERAGNLKVAPGRGVHGQRAARHLFRGRTEERQTPALRQVEVIEDRANGGDIGTVEGAEGLDRRHAELRQQPLFRAGAVKA